jgi:hypothetical protein
LSNTPTPLFELKPGATVFYRLSSAPPEHLQALAAMVGAAPVIAVVMKVHGPRLVDLVLQPEDDRPEDTAIIFTARFVPFLHEGDPDPLSPMGRCHVGPLHTEKDYTVDHEIAEGKRPPRGVSLEVWQAALAKARAGNTSPVINQESSK